MTTLITMFILGNIFYSKDKEVGNKSLYSYSQRNVHYLIKPFIPSLDSIIAKERKRQSKIHYDKTNLRVIIVEDVAFWIKDNMVYKANMGPEGVDKDTTERVDMMGMDKVQLDKMLFIIDQLRDGKTDDNWSPGNE